MQSDGIAGLNFFSIAILKNKIVFNETGATRAKQFEALKDRFAGVLQLTF